MEFGATSATKECLVYLDYSTTGCPKMNLSRRQLRIFRRINAKLQTVPAFYVQHFAQIMQHFRRKFRRLHNLVNATRLIKRMPPKGKRQRVIIASRRFRRRGILRKMGVESPKPKLRIIWCKRKGKTFVGLCDIKERRKKMARHRRKVKKAEMNKDKMVKSATATTTTNPAETTSITQTAETTSTLLTSETTPIIIPVEAPISAEVSPKIVPNGNSTEYRPDDDNIFLLAMGSPLHETSYENQPIEDPITDIQFARVIEEENGSQDCVDLIDSDSDEKEIAPPVVQCSLNNLIKHVEPVNVEGGKDGDQDVNLGNCSNNKSIPLESNESDLETSLIIDESYNSDINIPTVNETASDSTTNPSAKPPTTSNVITENNSVKSNTECVDIEIDSTIKTNSCLLNVDSPSEETIAKSCSEDSQPNPLGTSDTNGTPANALTVGELNNQLREQLSFFKMGKRKETILGEPIGGALRVRSADTSRTGTPSLSRNASHASIDEHMITNTPEKANYLTNKLVQSSPSDDGQPPKRNFIDSLINRIKLNTNIDAISTQRENRKSISTPQERNNNNDHPPTTLSLIIPKKVTSNPLKKTLVSMMQDDEISDHSESNEFLGFNQTDMSEIEAGQLVPNKASVKSAFVSEALDNFMKENSLENAANVVMPVVQFRDDALVTSDSTPPSLTCPQLPTHIEKPRTLAAKREQLEGQTDVKLLMIENESSVFRELKKRTRPDFVPNYRHIRWIQDHDIPFTRDCWRATSWLATRMGRFYYQTVRTKDDQNLKVFGGIGNYHYKCLVDISNAIDTRKIYNRCSRKCRSVEGIRVSNLSLLDPKKHFKKDIKSIKSTRHLSLIKPNTFSNFNRHTTCGPLSKKRLCDSSLSLDLELGPLQIYHMPSIHLEVWPKLENPLPDQVRPFLKMALPFNCMTSKWVNFALTALKVPMKENYTTLSGRSIAKASYNEDKLAAAEKSSPIVKRPTNVHISYVFDIPYANDQKRLLIRKRKKLESICSIGTKASVCQLDNDECITFDKNVDVDDAVAVDVAGILRGMLNAVEISANESILWKEDPDFKDSVDKPNLGPHKQSELEVLIRKETSNSTRIRKELKRLNATIIDNYEAPAKQNCTEVYCRMGCVCDSLTISKSHPQHCKKLQCMFECSCNLKSLAAMESRNSNIEQLRSRATADLAKEEKEFTATVVLSQDRTIYIPNHDNVGKRNKRVPKRFHDSVETPFAVLDSSNSPPSSRKHKLDANEDQSSTSSSSSHSPIKRSRLQAELHKMPHCNVSLLKMPSLDSLEPWCMVHCLYKCYCKLRATTGKPFTFDEPGAIVTEPDESVTASKKRQYTFEKPGAVDETAKQNVTIIDEALFEEQSARTRLFVRVKPERTKQDIEKLKANYRTFEDDHPALKKLLNHHKRRCWMNSGTIGIHVIETVEDGLEKDEPVKGNFSIKHQEQPKRVKNSGQFVKCTKKDDLPQVEVPKAVDNAIRPVEIEEQPIIIEDDHRIPITCNIPENASAEESSRRKHEHNMKYFNYCVNKTMDQVKNAQINTVVVKEPISKNLNCIQWNRLVDLFNENKVFVWEIQLKSMEIILGLTVENIMPLVPGAVSAMNIRVVSTDRLALVARLLKQGFRNANTAQLAVLLFGASNYWQIISLIHSNKNYLEEDHRVQPTPRSHPQLASKIAKLFAMLTRNRNSSRKFGQAIAPTPQPLTSIIRPRTTLNVVLPAGGLPVVRGIGTLPVVGPIGTPPVGRPIGTLPAVHGIGSLPFVRGLSTLPGVRGMVPLPGVRATGQLQGVRGTGPLQATKVVALPKAAPPMPVLRLIAPRPVPHNQTVSTAPPSPAVQSDKPRQPETKSTKTYINTKYSRNIDPSFVPRCNIAMTPDRNIASFLPVLPEVGEHKWFMLTLGQDFTHIYIRSWNSFLSHDKIKSAIVMAQRFGKTVKISAPNIIPDVFAAPNEPGKVFFGPYAKDANLEMGLYYSVNNKILPTEEYFKLPAKNPDAGYLIRSSGCWLKVIQTTPVAIAVRKSTSSSSSTDPKAGTSKQPVDSCSKKTEVKESITGPSIADEKCVESDDDCMIVENHPEVIDVPEDEVEQPNESEEKPTSLSQLEKMISLSPKSISHESTAPPLELLKPRSLLKPAASSTILTIEKVKSAISEQLSQMTKTVKPPKISIMSSLKKPVRPQNKPAKSQPNPASLLPLSITLTTTKKKTPEKAPEAITATASTSLSNKINEFVSSDFVDISKFPSSLSNLTIFRIPSTDETPKSESEPSPKVTLTQQAVVDKHLSKTIRLPKSLVISKIPSTNKRSSTDSVNGPPSKKPNQSEVPEVTISECIDLGSDDEAIQTDEHETKPKVKGYLVCTLGVWLGRIVAHIRDDNLYRAYVLGSKIDAIDLPTMNKLLEIQIRKYVYAVEPRHLQLEWKFIDEKNEDQWTLYPRLSTNMFAPTMVITEQCIIDLRCDFESNSSLSRELLLRLLVLKLAYLCRCDREEVRSCSFNDILKKGEAQVHSYVTRDAKYESLKMSWALKLRSNKLKLHKLQQSLGVSPKYKIRQSMTLAGNRKHSSGAVPRAASLPPITAQSSASVIEIDDDE